MGLNIEKIVRMQQDLTETILSHNTFEIYGKTILESIDNYKHISNMDLKFSSDPSFSSLYDNCNKSIDDLIGIAILDNNFELFLNCNLDELLHNMSYYQKYYLLRLFNDTKICDRVYFIKVLNSIIKMILSVLME